MFKFFSLTLAVVLLLCVAQSMDNSAPISVAKQADAAFEETSSEVHRIAFGSCNNADRMGLWANIEATSPHSLILLGDNVYADRKQGLYKGYDFVVGSRFLPASDEDFARQYRLLSGDPQFQSLVHSLGGMLGGDGNVRGIYDDHDYGINNGDRTYANKVSSQKYFLDFLEVPLESPRRQLSGVYNSKMFEVMLPSPKRAQSNKAESTPMPPTRPFRYKIILLDGRTNKDPKPGTKTAKVHALDSDRSLAFDKHTEGTRTGKGDFLGEPQWEWLARELLGEDEDPADGPLDLIILGSGVQVIPEDKVLEETWYEFPHARQRLLNMLHYIRTVGGRPNVVILSGDVHTAEVLQGSWACETDTDTDTGSYMDKRQKHNDQHLWEFTSSGLTHTFVKQTPMRPDLHFDGVTWGAPPTTSADTVDTGTDTTNSRSATTSTSSGDVTVRSDGVGAGVGVGPEPIFSVLPTLTLPFGYANTEAAALGLAEKLRALEDAMISVLTLDDPSYSAAASVATASSDPPSELFDSVQESHKGKGKGTEAGKGKDTSTALAESLLEAMGGEGDAGEKGAEQGEHEGEGHTEDVPTDLLVDLQEALRYALESTQFNISAVAEVTLQVLEEVGPPDATQEWEAVTSLVEALWSLFDDPDAFSSNALADGATYGVGERDEQWVEDEVEGEHVGVGRGASFSAHVGASRRRGGGKRTGTKAEGVVSGIPTDANGAQACTDTFIPLLAAEQDQGKSQEGKGSDTSASTGKSKSKSTNARIDGIHADHTPQLSRGSFYEALYDSFVATGASQARQHRFKDHYKGLHFGVLDIRQESNGNTGTGTGDGEVSLKMEISMLDNFNRPVIRRVVPLLAPTPRSDHASLADMMAYWDTRPGEIFSGGDVLCDFLPYHGHTSLFRKRLAKWGLLLLPIVGGGVPLLVLVYLLYRLVRGLVSQSLRLLRLLYSVVGRWRGKSKPKLSRISGDSLTEGNLVELNKDTHPREAGEVVVVAAAVEEVAVSKDAGQVGEEEEEEEEENSDTESEPDTDNEKEPENKIQGVSR